MEQSYHKLSKTTPWRNDQKTFLYHGIKRNYGPFRGGGEGKGYFIPDINFILCHGIKIKSVRN
jgi:hypothetical protein